MSELADLLALAEAAARQAGEELRKHRAEWSGVTADLGRELKVEADKKAEALILATLAAHGDIPVLSEEAGWDDAAIKVKEKHRKKARFWAVDPLDGSANYIQGYPHCAVSIALMDEGRPILGVVDCFLLGERFTGIVDQGAWLNGAPITVSSEADPARGILNTGVPAAMRDDAKAMKRMARRLMEWRKVRMLGSAAAALAYVAAGRAEAYSESGAMLWDVAAGCALVEAAGGVVRIEGERLEGPLDVAATNGKAPSPD
ncbi:MAG: inositol monophosphatase [Hyphomonadaceae bacterium]|nr:inositol monophosphatase [Hyphomonadaceae bacterium]